MKPGRKLDALIAEKVMGLGPWTHKSEWIYGEEPGDGYGKFSGWWCEICHGTKMPAGVHCSKPSQEICYCYWLDHYSTNITAAFEVVAKLRRMCCCVVLDFDHHYVTDVKLRLDRDGSHGPKDWDVWISGIESTPHAICLAALEAIKEK